MPFHNDFLNLVKCLEPKINEVNNASFYAKHLAGLQY